ncbi:integrase catalytic domain-containing protein [Trichonephila clavipes]|nr:integrase catalytic domain-containing protein [Trichonephila clavipes]
MIPSLFGESLIGQLPYSRTVKKHAAAVYSIFCTGVENDLIEIDTFLQEDEVSAKTGVSLRDFGKEIKKGNGCCEVPLQLKTNGIKGNLSSNYNVAEKRFIPFEKRFYRDESLFERYNSVMKKQLKQGIIERCTENYFAGYVMPHHEVFREISSSTKTGVVYDASSKQENNLSLNECLISGENLNLIHIDVTLKFIEYLQNLMIPRYYYSPTNLINRNDLQLHIFSDASPKSFGAVAYLRYKIFDSKFNTTFVISKSRVAPIKKITLTRLELMGAVIAARLVKQLKRIFKDIKRIILSSVTRRLCYIELRAQNPNLNLSFQIESRKVKKTQTLCLGGIAVVRKTRLTY